MRKSKVRIAKKLRKHQTEAEQRLWRHLRNKQLGGFKFRRQQPIGPYIVDFVSFDGNLVIEVDGGQHAANKENDLKRDQWLQSEGYGVLRFWNTDVIRNIEGVIAIIRKKLVNSSPSG
ncbi:hypothetical protein D3OALGA1CA_3040 [Olavius algarvensis associated proteobacterium Delta 3]|nr:hypothetical protein D3OALGA1CA_3040 [Olavius algarvensis associated proteobacterium Delta 3]CAB5157752.1 hypothetical protein D3OALGB2SA_5221 [Olavius algarvensis associated proteobacterium Delta 3]